MGLGVESRARRHTDEGSTAAANPGLCGGGGGVGGNSVPTQDSGGRIPVNPATEIMKALGWPSTPLVKFMPAHPMHMRRSRVAL
jgi:hypothetical protein